MGKALIIKGADFSAVSVEKIEIERELSGLASAWIAASGNVSMSNEQKFAVDDFVLATSKFLVKFKKIYLSFLSEGLANSLINYGDIKLNNDAPFNFSTFVGYKNKGIYSKGGSSSDRISIEIEELSSNNLSLFTLNTEELTPISSGSTVELPAIGIGTSANDRAAFNSTQTAAAYRINAIINGYLRDTSYNINDTTDGRLGIALRGVVFGQTSAKGLLSDGSTIEVVYPADLTHNSHTELSILGNRALTTLSASELSIGAMFVGEALTDNETVILKNAIEKLFSFFA